MLHRLLAAAILLILPEALAADPAEPTSMRFEWVKEGPAEACGDQCREWIWAHGPITGDTVRDFDIFTDVRDARGATIVLDSGGGSVIASLELGRKVRQLGMSTTVGRSEMLKGAPGEARRAKLSPRGECASMCVFVLLGGATRIIPPEARVLVHQIWPGGKRYDASAEHYTAEEMVRIQRDVGRIASYTVEMGADIELFELAMRIPPWERLRSLTTQELRRMKLNTAEAPPEARTSGALTGSRVPPKVGSLSNERGWIPAQIENRPALSRRHVLTIEGDEVGRFQLALQCGALPGAYRVTYDESRSLDADAQLREVTISIDGDRTVLQIEESARQAKSGALETRAAGDVTGRQLAKLQTDPEGAVVVTTATDANLRTSIRVGSSGFAKQFQKLAAECSQSAAARESAPVKLSRAN